jgi:hypothetical protein
LGTRTRPEVMIARAIDLGFEPITPAAHGSKSSEVSIAGLWHLIGT